MKREAKQRITAVEEQEQAEKERDDPADSEHAVRRGIDVENEQRQRECDEDEPRHIHRED